MKLTSPEKFAEQAIGLEMTYAEYDRMYVTYTSNVGAYAISEIQVTKNDGEELRYVLLHGRPYIIKILPEPKKEEHGWFG